MLKFVLKKLNSLFFLKFNQGINWFMTLYVNVSLFPLKDALKFPILIYGKCYTCCLDGKVIFEREIKKGLLIIGRTDPVRSFDSSSVINLAGKIVIKSNAEIRRGLHVQINPEASLELGENVFISDNSTIICTTHIKIGDNTQIGNNCTLMDTDFHYIINTISNQVHQARKPIIIGKNNWIAGYNVVKKGAITPEGTILAGPYSMIGKDYSQKIREYSIIGGSPAKLISENYRRINNYMQQKMLNEYFTTHDTFYQYSSHTVLDKICSPNNF